MRKLVAPVRDSALPPLDAIAHVDALRLTGHLALPDLGEIPIQHLEYGVDSMELDGEAVVVAWPRLPAGSLPSVVT